LVLFVVGGVSALEVQQLQDQLQAAQDQHGGEEEGGGLMRVFVGSTALVGPEDVFHQVFVQMRRPQARE
jgi:hypothetical protein